MVRSKPIARPFQGCHENGTNSIPRSYSSAGSHSQSQEEMQRIFDELTDDEAPVNPQTYKLLNKEIGELVNPIREMCALLRNGNIKARTHHINSEGSPPNQIFEVQCTLNSSAMCSAYGITLKEARENAVAKTLKFLGPTKYDLLIPANTHYARDKYSNYKFQPRSRLPSNAYSPWKVDHLYASHIKCPFCDERYRFKRDLLAHQHVECAPSHHCVICDQAFVWKQDFKQHLLESGHSGLTPRTQKQDTVSIVVRELMIVKDEPIDEPEDQYEPEYEGRTGAQSLLNARETPPTLAETEQRVSIAVPALRMHAQIRQPEVVCRHNEWGKKRCRSDSEPARNDDEVKVVYPGYRSKSSLSAAPETADPCAVHQQEFGDPWKIMHRVHPTIPDEFELPTDDVTLKKLLNMKIYGRAGRRHTL